MAVTPAVPLTVADASAVAEARRTVTALARRVGFDEAGAGRVALVVTELATNLVKHGGGGEVVARALEERSGPGLELLALDRGPGIENVAACLRDGFSTGGSPGTGLGAVARMSSLFQVYSAPGRGTAMLAQLRAPQDPTERPEPPLDIGGVSVAKPGEEECGDAWTAEHRADGAVLLVADGLGHGPLAAAASREAVGALRRGRPRRPAAVVDDAHAALRATRGAAVAVAEVDCERGLVRFAGIGNIGGTVLSDGGSRNLVSHNGIAGHNARAAQEFTYPWLPDAVLVLHSDGLASHWSVAAYPGLTGKHPTLIAGVLYRDFARRRDDVTVVVVKRRAA
jgi:anti-sigma regulatory factor (Ser/Thr protein kinase)